MQICKILKSLSVSFASFQLCHETSWCLYFVLWWNGRHAPLCTSDNSAQTAAGTKPDMDLISWDTGEGWGREEERTQYTQEFRFLWVVFFIWIKTKTSANYLRNIRCCFLVKSASSSHHAVGGEDLWSGAGTQPMGFILIVSLERMENGEPFSEPEVEELNTELFMI